MTSDLSLKRVDDLAPLHSAVLLRSETLAGLFSDCCLSMRNPNLRERKKNKTHQMTKKNMKDIEKSKKGEANSDALPLDVMIEIWLRLPAKSLARFRFVSKSWCTSLADTNFVNEHLHRSKQDRESLKILISTERDRVYGLYSVEHDQIQPSGSDQHMLEAKQLVDPVKKKSMFDGRYVVVLGSCNGVICCIYPVMDKICLWNPCNGESRMFASSFDDKTREPWHYDVFGFGYSPVAKEYEVVRVGQAKMGLENHSAAYAYSLAMNRCRIIPNIPYKFSDKKHSGEFVNGALHWLACPSNKCTGILRYEVLLAYDIGGEDFREVPQPMYGDRVIEKRSLTEFEDKLCICCYYNTGHIDVWIMEEYGVKESWAKLFDVKYDADGSVGCKPLCYTNNGCALLFIEKSSTEKCLVLYDPKSHNQYPLKLRDDKVAAYDGRTFTESLVKLQ